MDAGHSLSLSFTSNTLSSLLTLLQPMDFIVTSVLTHPLTGKHVLTSGPFHVSAPLSGTVFPLLPTGHLHHFLRSLLKYYPLPVSLSKILLLPCPLPFLTSFGLLIVLRTYHQPTCFTYCTYSTCLLSVSSTRMLVPQEQFLSILLTVVSPVPRTEPGTQ